jgi:hypothetical protein
VVDPSMGGNVPSLQSLRPCTEFLLLGTP